MKMSYFVEMIDHFILLIIIKTLGIDNNVLQVFLGLARGITLLITWTLSEGLDESVSQYYLTRTNKIWQSLLPLFHWMVANAGKVPYSNQLRLIIYWKSIHQISWSDCVKMPYKR